MNRFAQLFGELDATNSTLEKVDALQRYFAAAEPIDAAWAVYILMGRKLPNVVKRKDLRRWCIELAEIPEWLFKESHAAVGDLAETVTLLLQDVPFEEAETPAEEAALHDWVRRIHQLRGLSEMWQRMLVVEYWGTLGARGRFVFNKLLTGAFRVGVSQNLVVRALAQHAGVEQAVMAHRLAGQWKPSEEAWRKLLATKTEVDLATPYPFFLATALSDAPAALGESSRWSFEWKWDGIRAQAIKRAGEVVLWSRGNELLTERFPEVADSIRRLPDGTVLDGELLAYQEGAPLPFSTLQTRIQRVSPSQAHIDAAPVVFMAYDVLEQGGDDRRELPLFERRALLELLVDAEVPKILASQTLDVDSWEAAERLKDGSRERGVEGLMVKDPYSPYLAGRRRGSWWKWKVEPLSIDAVLLYAQMGSGKRSNLFTDYTFGLWKGGDLVPIAKAYSGLDDEEILKLDRWIRGNTNEKFGPVRNVKPHHVFELNFDSARYSNRHKSGVALRFPRIHRWRRDKAIQDANQLSDLEALIHAS